jgi:hypothetical protein
MLGDSFLSFPRYSHHFEQREWLSPKLLGIARRRHFRLSVSHFITEESPMTDLEKFADLATKLHQEEPNPIVLPITQTGQQTDRPWHARNTFSWEHGEYVCMDNGKGCGRGFRDRVSKNRHRQWCQKVQQ